MAKKTVEYATAIVKRQVYKLYTVHTWLKIERGRWGAISDLSGRVSGVCDGCGLFRPHLGGAPHRGRLLSGHQEARWHGNTASPTHYISGGFKIKEIKL